MARIAAALAAVSLLVPGPAAALDPDRSISQYKHSRWTASEGAPPGIMRIAQTPDGYLWLTAYSGLFRFDGVSFERVDGRVDQATDGAAWFVTTGPRGEVWTYYPASKRFRVYEKGRLRVMPVPKPDGTVIGISHTPDGDMWIAGGRKGQPMLRYHGGRWSSFQPDPRLAPDTNMGMLVTADGALWVAYGDNVFRRLPGRARFERLISDPGAQMRLSLDPAGRVWVTGGGFSRPVSEPGGRWTGRPAAFRYPADNHPRRGIPIFDRQGNLWIALRKDGLQRIRTPSPEGPRGPIPVPEQFRSADGLSSDAAYVAFEDREGNIWVGTTLGLDRFRDADIISEPLLKQPAAYGDIIFADSRGNVFVGERDTVYRIAPGGAPQPVIIDSGEPEAICEGPDGAVWVSLADRMVALRGDSRGVVERPRGLASVVKDCGADRWGRFWLSSEESGFFLRTASGWRRVATGLPASFKAGQMVRDAAGDLWVNGGSGRLARIDESGPRLVPLPAGGKLRDIRTLAPYGDGLLLAGIDAIGLLANGRLSLIAADRMGTLLNVNGIVRTRRGETWTFTQAGLTRMLTGDVERAFADPGRPVARRTFGFLDGLIDSNSVRTPRALVEGGDGRLWAATATGIVWIDPARLTSNRLPPKLAIRSVDAGGRRFVDPEKLELPAGAADVTIGFAVLSLRMPERVQVRYRLEGQDHGWISPGLRRQAFYTNLPPGNYRFRVVAANENGVWNREGATLEFSIPPTFVQSVWFKLLLALLLGLLLAAAYILRVRQVTARLKSRFDVRIAERERIARELHDTLLQGFQGLLLQFKAIANRLPAIDESRRSLDAALARAQQVLIEGRNRVKDLRADEVHADLAAAIVERAGAQVPAGGPRVSVTCEGAARALHPLVSEEMLRIVEEAVRNAVLHAEPSEIQILLQWTRRELRMSVRDDGRGMPDAVLASGAREGHFGLVGMRERAERVGGKLVLATRRAAGTEVVVEVPAKAAYRDRTRSWRDPASWRKVAAEREPAE